MAEEGRILKQRYRILREGGRGSFGTPYQAEDLERGGLCAVKCLHLALTESWKSVELFEREAKVLANLDYPNIPKFLEFFLEEGTGPVRFYLVQSFVEGKNLHELLESGKQFAEAEVIAIARQLTSLLIYLHSFSPPLLHRDMKPSNIIVDDQGGLYLIDMSCNPSYNRVGTVFGNTVKETSIRLDLEPSRDNECYGLQLNARKNGRPIGMLITHGGGGYGWDYRFRIKP